MGKHQCIYCLQYKEAEEFNREHVVPRMMGTYENGYVLNDNQVCEECNTFFCNELENKIGLDSYEAFLRMQHQHTPMSDGRRLAGLRIQLKGNEGIFKGIPFTVITDQTSPQRIRLYVPPLVGIISCPERQEYDYYSIGDLPVITDEVAEKIKGAPDPIVNTGIPKEELEPILIQKGYLHDGFKYSEHMIKDMHPNPEFLTAIDLKIDSIMRRVCAKTVFNYLCFSRGSTYVLNPQFNAIRKYIRYGIWSEELWFRYSRGPVTTAEMPNATSHVVGYMWFNEGGRWILCGCLTWFGELTYIFKLGDIGRPVQLFNLLEATQMACFNNETRTISTDEAVHVYGGRNES